MPEHVPRIIEDDESYQTKCPQRHLLSALIIKVIVVLMLLQYSRTFLVKHPYENVLHPQAYSHVNQTHFHMKGFARGLVGTRYLGNGLSKHGRLSNTSLHHQHFIELPMKPEFIQRGQVSKETVVLHRWEYYKIIWFYQLG